MIDVGELREQANTHESLRLRWDEITELLDRLEAAETHVAAAQIAKDNLFEEVQALEQKLRAEWDRWRQVAEELVEAEKREQALAAHVEKIQQSWPYRNGVGPPQLLRKMGRVLQESPETSLACLNAQHVEAALRHAEALLDAGATADEAFDTIRRQAEEPKS